MTTRPLHLMKKKKNLVYHGIILRNGESATIESVGILERLL